MFVFWLGAGLIGCSGRAEVYTAGVRVQETQETSDVRTEESELSAPDAKSANAKSNAESAGAKPDTESAAYVYVCGAVTRPGVYPIHEGMRVFEALELAGGFAPDADREWLNQAEPLQDGQRLYVYTKEETLMLAEDLRSGGQADSPILWAENAGTPGDVGADDASGPQSDEQKVNLNTADREQLKTLPGIGDAKADAILQYREEHGPFGAIEEIQNISGIKNAVFSKIKDLITV